mmetsp:Transcript_16261/g.21062  ORF Transcript_16261/g.21062 Transcript_16261/m.21062 type:complete len:957 (+) Transcript_16261:81-2951(+)
MHGWIIDALEKMILDKHGQVKYEEIKTEANCQIATGGWVLLELYPDKIINDLIDAASRMLSEEKTSILEEVGRYFMAQVRKMGYANLLNCHGTTLRSWLENVNLLHDHLQSTMPVEKFLFPLIYCIDNPEAPDVVDESETSFIVQYRSARGLAYAPFLKGIIYDTSEYYFSMKVSLDQIKAQGEDGSEYTSWILTKIDQHIPESVQQDTDSVEKRNESSNDQMKNAPPPMRCPFSHRQFEVGQPASPPSPSLAAPNQLPMNTSYGMSPEMLNQVFPFFIKFNRELVVESIGPQLAAHCSPLIGQTMDELFCIVKPPSIAWCWEDIKRHFKTTFEIDVISPHDMNKVSIQLIGGIYLDDTGGYLLMQPAVYTIADMVDHGLKWDTAIPRHSLQRRLIMVGEHLKSEAYTNRESQQEIAEKKHSLEMKRLFVRYVSHEIRNPLNTVSLGLELIQALPSYGIDRVLQHSLKAAKAEKNLEVVENITQAMESLASIFDMTNEVKESCDIAISILNDLLLYEKIEGGLLALECRTQPVVDLVFDTARVFAIQSRAAKIELKLSYDDAAFSENEQSKPTTFVYVDKPKFTQVIRNLLSNAIKFSPENSIVELFITTVTKFVPTESSSQEYVRIEVQDSGAGLTAGNIQQLFGNIVQFDAEKLQGGGGSGIGLFISKGIMDMHDGFIGACSEGLGYGSTFYLEVPISEVVDATPNVSVPPSPVRELSPVPTNSIDALQSSSMVNENSSDLDPDPATFIAAVNLNTDDLIEDKNQLSLHEHEQNASCGSSFSDNSSEASSDDFDNPLGDRKRNKKHVDMKLKSKKKELIGRPLNILVVDDSVGTRKMVSRYLKMSKICPNADHASDGLQALQKVRENLSAAESMNGALYDAILMDQNMPNLEGPGASIQIRQLGYTGLLIGVTGQLQPEDQQHFKDCGANHVLAKPVDLVSLRDLLEGSPLIKK